MCEISEMHECDNLPTDTVQICKSNNILDVDGEQWIMCVTRDATLKDLEENHNFELEGDIVWTTYVAIICCPYCGSKLQEKDLRYNDKRQLIKHIDSSGYYVKVM